MARRFLECVGTLLHSCRLGEQADICPITQLPHSWVLIKPGMELSQPRKAKLCCFPSFHTGGRTWEVSPPESARLAQQDWSSTGAVSSSSKISGAIVTPAARSRVGEQDLPGVSLPAPLRLLNVYPMQSFGEEEE